MVFSSLIFLYLFLPLNLALYFLAGWRPGSREKRCRATDGATTLQNWILVVFSLFFYAWGEPVWVILLVYTSVVDWLVGLWIERTRGTTGAKIALTVSLCSNLSLLAVFKYGDFFLGSLNHLSGVHLPLLGTTLPIGISFYTFQTISYVVDVYRGEVRAQRRFLKFLLFVSLYHQLVAGPIVRYIHIAREIEDRRHDPILFSRGLHRVCIGLAKKVLIANVAGEWAHRIFDGDLSHLAFADAWLGLVAFALQIYFDFSGYSDMAIGLGMIFGFHYHENFKHPYISASVSEFWRRWHISLGSFFRDYVYAPLGGIRARPLRSLLIVWGLTGLWHGASWNFVLWGLYFGVFIALERLILARVLAALPRVARHTYLLLVVLVGWALFYFTDTARLLTCFHVLTGASSSGLVGSSTLADIASHAVWLILAIVGCMPVVSWLRQRGLNLELSPPRAPIGWAALIAIDLALLVASSASLVGQGYNPFIYFRF
jgi:alginate O-acetyltransferase complex protein AlgI